MPVSKEVDGSKLDLETNLLQDDVIEEDVLDILLKIENIIIMVLGLAFVISLIYIIVLKKKNKTPKVPNVENQ